MKINILYGSGDILAGYLTINPFCPTETDDVKRCDVRNLDKYLDDAECESIVAWDVLDYISLPEREKVVNHWVSKLARGGTLLIGGTDLRLVSKSVSAYQIEPKGATVLLYGVQEQPWGIKRSMSTCVDTAQMMRSMGLKVLRAQYEGFQYFVEVVRT